MKIPKQLLKYPQNSHTAREMDIELPLIAFDELLKVQATQTLTCNQEGERSIVQEAIITDERKFNYESIMRTKQDEGFGKIKGSVKTEFGIDEHNLIESILLDAQLTKDDDMPLMQIKMESYYLREYPLLPITDQDTINLGQQIQKKEKARNKKSLWERFNDYLNSPI